MRPAPRQAGSMLAGAGGILLGRFLLGRVVTLEPLAGTEMAAALSTFVRIGSEFAAVGLVAAAVWCLLIRPHWEVSQ